MSMYVDESTLYTSATSLNPKPQLNLVMNNVEIEQVEETKLGITMDCKLLCLKHNDATVAKIGRRLSIIKRYSALSTRKITTDPEDGSTDGP